MSHDSRRTRSRALSPYDAATRIVARALGFLVRRIYRGWRGFRITAERLQVHFGMSRGLNTLRMTNNSRDYEYRRLGTLNALVIPESQRRTGWDPVATFEGEEWPGLLPRWRFGAASTNPGFGTLVVGDSRKSGSRALST